MAWQRVASTGTVMLTGGCSYSGTSLVADVSYDAFLSSSATGSDDYEVMVWLAALGGAGPISATGKPVASNVAIGSNTFNLYAGPNGQMTTFSFVATSTINNFSGDFKSFLTYLVQHQGVSNSQYLLSLGAGTEPFTGSNAKFTTSKYSAVVA